MVESSARFRVDRDTRQVTRFQALYHISLFQNSASRRFFHNKAPGINKKFGWAYPLPRLDFQAFHKQSMPLPKHNVNDLDKHTTRPLLGG